MGWSFCPAHKEATPLLFFEKHVIPILCRNPIAYKAIGTTIYAVCEDGYALVCLTEGNCGYKLIHEECGPFYYNCPKEIFDMLKWPAPSKYAEEWRNKCAACFK